MGEGVVDEGDIGGVAHDQVRGLNGLPGPEGEVQARSGAETDDS